MVSTSVVTSFESTERGCFGHWYTVYTGTIQTFRYNVPRTGHLRPELHCQCPAVGLCRLESALRLDIRLGSHWVGTARVTGTVALRPLSLRLAHWHVTA
jgi:hypothetical protein